MKVLVVEDDADHLELVSQCIRFQWPKVEIVGAADGRQGLSLAETERPDLVILDIGLPDVNGLIALRRLREFSDVPVIVLTGHGQDRAEDVALFLTEGADDYIVKPFIQVELIARIEALLRRAPEEINSLVEDSALGPGVGKSAQRAGSASGRAKPSNRGVKRKAAVQGVEVERLYDGTVRLVVETQGNITLVDGFVQWIRELDGFDVVRLAENRLDGVDVWLSLRQPQPLRKMLRELEGVADVRPTSRGLSPDGDAPSLRITLGAA